MRAILQTMGEMLLEGEFGAIELDGDGVLSFRAHGQTASEAIPYDWDNVEFGGDCVYRLQKHVIDWRLHGGKLENAARDYLTNLEIEEAVYESNTSGARVSLRD